MISGSGSALLDPANLQALVDGCTDQEFRVQYKDEKKVLHQSRNSQSMSETGKRENQKVVFEAIMQSTFIFNFAKPSSKKCFFLTVFKGLGTLVA